MKLISRETDRVYGKRGTGERPGLLLFLLTEWTVCVYWNVKSRCAVLYSGDKWKGVRLRYLLAATNMALSLYEKGDCVKKKTDTSKDIVQRVRLFVLSEKGQQEIKAALDKATQLGLEFRESCELDPRKLEEPATI
jgi:hypothetical protein